METREQYATEDDRTVYHITYPLEQWHLLIVDANHVLVGNFRMHQRPVSAFEDFRQNPAPDPDELEALVAGIVRYCNDAAKLALDNLTEIAYHESGAKKSANDWQSDDLPEVSNE